MSSRLDSITDWQARAVQADFRVDRLAASCGVTERQLRRYFSLKFACSPRALITRIRMAKAQSLILEGKSVKEAAAEVHFGNQGSLWRQFKSKYHRSPSTFRAAE